MNKEDIIILGAIKTINNRLEILDKLNSYRVVEIWDNYVVRKVVYKEKEWEVKKPHGMERFIPILIIPSNHEKEIRKQLLQMGIPGEYIKSWWYCYHKIKKDIIKKYSSESNYQIQTVINYLKDNELYVFNNGLYEKYQDKEKEITVEFDEEAGLVYSYWNKQKIYLKRGMNAKSAKSYINSLHMEQDRSSPHCYEQNCIIGRQSDVIVDAGAAEGFFSLERAESARHIYLVECDQGWIEALKHTFAPYANKVTIIKKYLSNKSDEQHVTLDELDNMGIPISVVKMDIEGEERYALEGGKRLLSQNRKIDIVSCSYHKTDDYKMIAEILLKNQFKVSFTDGYMFFPYGDSVLSELRHGLVCGKKEKKYNVYIWGIGKSYKSLRNAFKENCKILGLLDSYAESKNEVVMNPQILRNACYDYVLVTAVHYDTILDSYKKMGLPREKIICLWDEEDDLYDFIDYHILKYVKQHYYIEKYRLRLANAPYEFSGEQEPKIIDATILLKEIYENRKSLARFGDGEFELMRMRERPWFQEVDKNLAERLKEVLNSNLYSLCIAIANNFGSLAEYTDSAADAIRAYLTKDNSREEIIKLFPPHRIFYDAYVSRPYIIYRDKHGAETIFRLWKKVWGNRNILLVEGKTSRMGVNNDLLMNVGSVRRILCPDINAFSKYKAILERVVQYAKKGDLIMIKLGPTATVLAYDLAQMGYQAIDIGQLDNEYDWYRMGVEKQVEIKGKMVAESLNGRLPDEIDDVKYKDEIICCVE